MDIKKLNPWNWFGHEEPTNLPAVRHDRQAASPGDALMQLQSEMDRAFAGLIRSFGLPGPSVWNSSLSGTGDPILRPHVDVVSGDREYKITVEVPGVDERDVKLELSADGALVISGEKRRDHEEASGQFHRIERSYSAFRRILSLPDDVDRDQVDAQFKNGVLTITCPRIEAAAAGPVRQIDIRKVA